ncbi:putative C2H2 finger domain protein [Aspergillus homomorphus CBS 101889]|uniref:C2H2 finger domain protein n=1 Tax=Aspergillus homomorphus (strain CBS 101889) TaxID=1450537 RepID=A0A395HHA7_ASPHC|nr:C2H2 finger domain protein [Aspergillus homomorphus CBS 101889]RAL07207.1 C2H2 finger domain protein [Aspergillus homomorphus CBS 101889]
MMSSTVAAVAPLEQGFKGSHEDTHMPTEIDTADAALHGASRKRKRARKIQTDRKFECTFENCGKSYSRAEHLYRHQLNHTPKQIYRCDFPDCYRSFVRQDLCVRHRERHTTQGSQLQKRDSFAQAAVNNAPIVPAEQKEQPIPKKIDGDSPTGIPAASPQYPSTQAPIEGRIDPIALQSIKNIGTKVTAVLSSRPGHSPPTYKYQPPLSQPGVELSDTTFSRSVSLSNHTNSSPTGQSTTTFSPSEYQTHRSHPSTSVSLHNGETCQQTRARHPADETTMLSSYMEGPSLAHSASYPPIPVGGYTDISLGPATASASTTLNNVSTFEALDSVSGMMAPGSTVGDPSFDALTSCVYPIFGGETHNRSPFAMPEDFTAWLFNDPLPGSSSMGYPSATNMIPNYLNAIQLQNQFLPSDPGYGSFMNGVIPHDPMSVTSILDAGSSRMSLSNDKRQELLALMGSRFNEAAYSAVAKRKDALMDGDMNDDRHVLGPRMMEAYIASYWQHLHPQLPILHRPSFVLNKAPNLLLLAVIAIGASTLDKVYGADVTETAAELANFIAWHLRWELFMDADFRPPAKLWVFQALLLLEVYEKMYSTRALHERAHIHHDTTLTLMRRGSSLIGRSALDSPASLRDERQTRSVTGSTMTPDFVAEESWTHWIKAEATRRVAFAAFVLDSTHATMFGHSAKMVAHELRLPLPCDGALWSATNASEVARVQSSLHANGVKPLLFLDGLKRTLNGQPVRTNAFGRTILMAGLLSVSWHMNQRDLQVSSLGVLQALGGRDKWRSALLRAFDNWRRDFDEALGTSESGSFSGGYRARHPWDEANVFESRDVLHGLAHMASHVDIVDCQVFAGAGRLMGRAITRKDYDAAREKMVRWATKATARDATFYALRFLSECLLDGERALDDDDVYSGRDDYLLNRPWVLYVAALVVWCYGYALEGPLLHPVKLATPAEQRHDMQQFLRRVGGVREPSDLEGMKGCNQCMGLLLVLRNGFTNTRWELLSEAAYLLSSCMDKLNGGAAS